MNNTNQGQGVVEHPVPDRRKDMKQMAEVEHAREYVESMILNRLTKPRLGDLSDEEVEPIFKEVIPMLDRIMNTILNKTRIPGFTREDLEGFMLLLTHQIIRRGFYVPGTRPNGLFVRSFSNLMRDIHKMMTRAVNRGLYLDVIDTLDNRYFAFDETMLYGSVSFEYGVEWE